MFTWSEGTFWATFFQNRWILLSIILKELVRFNLVQICTRYRRVWFSIKFTWCKWYRFGGVNLIQQAQIDGDVALWGGGDKLQWYLDRIVDGWPSSGCSTVPLDTGPLQWYPIICKRYCIIQLILVCCCFGWIEHCLVFVLQSFAFELKSS
jgi:hypothetical protein